MPAGANGRDLVEQDRHALARGNDGSGQLVGIAHAPVRADGKPFAVAVDDARAGAGIVAVERGREILQREAHRGHPLHVGDDEIFLGVAAEGSTPASPAALLSCGVTIQSCTVRR